MAVLSMEAITRVLGPASERLATELAATGATETELAHAYAWLSNDEAFVNDMRHMPNARIAELIEILEQLDVPAAGEET